MNRKEFLRQGAIGAAGAAIFPKDLLSKEAKKQNKRLFPEILPYTKNGEWKEFKVFIDIAKHSPVPGFEYHTLAFNDSVPGKEIRVQQGDKVRVHFKNKTTLNHTIHWHGMHVPWRMDGVPFVTQLPVMPDNEFVYEFVAEPEGTHFYHCHWGTLLHMQAGMFAPLIIEQPDDPIKKRFGYEREYTFVYSAHDVNFIRNELNFMLHRMKERMYLMKKGKFDAERWGVFDSVEQIEEAIDDGYIPPYVNSRRAPSDLPQEQWFTINGKSYPSTPKLYIKEGENIRVRLINAGNRPFYLHLHGHDFWTVADDGLPLENPIHQNTIPLFPGKTNDIVIEGKNRGIWTFHDHDTRGATNNGLYPGGTLTTLVYEDLPEEELNIPAYSGNTMFKKMGGMQHDMKGMKMDGDKTMDMSKMMFGGDKLPKIALDE